MTRELILNIGLDNVPVAGESYTNGRRNPPEVVAFLQAVRAVSAAGFRILRSRLEDSDTEPTAVLEVVATRPLAGEVLDQLAVELGQEAIAAYLPAEARGWLAGPKAQAWGPFDPTKFLVPHRDALGATVRRLEQPA